MPMHTLQGAFTSGELSPSLTARVDLAKYQQGCKLLRNMLVQPHGGAVKRPGFLLLDSLPADAVLIPFVFNVDQAYCLVFGERWLRVARADGMIMNGASPYQIASPFTLEQARRLSYAQSADVLFLACQGVAPYRLKRYGHASWVFEPMNFSCPIAPPASVSGQFVNQAKKDNGDIQEAQCTTPYTYAVTALDAGGKESAISGGWNVTGPASNNWRSGDYIDVWWSSVAGATEYRIYKSEFSGRFGYVTASTGNSFRDYNVAAVLSDGPPKWKNPFPDGDYPATVCFFEQRLIFASTPKRPQTVWLSRSGDYDNFSASTPLKADDSVELTIASNEVSSVRWMMPLRSLVIGASGMEWEMASSEGALTAKTVKMTPQSYRGSAALRALIIGNTILHVTRSGREVRDLKYDFGADSYGGTDRTILAAHLLEDRRIMAWTYQPAPDAIIWAVRDDGVLLGMTFQAEHEVFAWHQHTTEGRFKTVCSVPNSSDDALYAVVERNGRYYLEVMAPRFDGLDTARCVYLDNAMLYEGAPVKILSGLSHLEGKTVGVLADGAVQGRRKVTGGKVELDSAARMAVVGLPFDADLETMPCELQTESGASVGRKKYINAVNVFFKDTVTARIGSSGGNLENIKWRTTEAHGAPLKPHTGSFRVVLPVHAQNVATVQVRSDEPLPMTVLAIVPELDVK